jgi:hypothetical protein
VLDLTTQWIKSHDCWCYKSPYNKHHCKRNGVKRSTSWGCRPTYAVFPCKATFLGFWWSLWAFSPTNLHTERPTWIQAHPRVFHNASFNLKQKWYQSDEGAVDGWLPSAKRAHIWKFTQLTPSDRPLCLLCRQTGPHTKELGYNFTSSFDIVNVVWTKTYLGTKKWGDMDQEVHFRTRAQLGTPPFGHKWYKSSPRLTPWTPYQFVLVQKYFICYILAPLTIKSGKLVRFVFWGSGNVIDYLWGKRANTLKFQPPVLWDLQPYAW